MVLPIKHALQVHPKSGKMGMKMIDNILITELGFRTTTYNKMHLYITKGWRDSIAFVVGGRFYA